LPYPKPKIAILSNGFFRQSFPPIIPLPTFSSPTLTFFIFAILIFARAKPQLLQIEVSFRNGARTCKTLEQILTCARAQAPTLQKEKDPPLIVAYKPRAESLLHQDYAKITKNNQAKFYPRQFSARPYYA
jgi:hypothetical protein